MTSFKAEDLLLLLQHYVASLVVISAIWW